MDLHELLRCLAAKRPIFHSEADFQHALAWEMHAINPNIEVRLEVPTSYGSQARAFVDVLTREGGRDTYYELKYKTVSTTVKLNNELFSLKNQSAQDQGSYDFLKDIARVESFVESNPGSSGYAIMLSNDQRYWSPRMKQTSIDMDFQLLDDRVLTGTLAWAPHAGIGSIKGRESPITLRRSYPIRWIPFSDLGAHGASSFRYLCLHITPDSAHHSHIKELITQTEL